MECWSVNITLVGSAAATDDVAFVPQHFEPDAPLALRRVFAAVEVDGAIEKRALIQFGFACSPSGHVHALVSAWARSRGEIQRLR